MCGRFSVINAGRVSFSSPIKPIEILPTTRNPSVAITSPRTRVLLLSERDEQLQLDPVHLYTSNKVDT
jgi:hypothetical protein